MHPITQLYTTARPMQPLMMGSVTTRLVATAGADATVRLFCSVTGCHLQTQQGHQDRVTCVQWSPCSGAWLASASLDGTARLWRLAAVPAGSPAAGAGDNGGQSKANGPQVQPLLEPAALLGGHSGRVSCLAFSPDSQLLATGSSEGQVWVWGVTRSSEGAHKEPEFKGQCGGLVTSVDFSPCGRVLAAASGGGCLGRGMHGPIGSLASTAAVGAGHTVLCDDRSACAALLLPTLMTCADT